MRRARTKIRTFVVAFGAMAAIHGIAIRSALAADCIQPDQIKVDTVDRPFAQERYLTGISEPLKSEGQLKITADKISWHMKKPFDVETVLTPDSITQSIDGGPAEPAAPDASGLSASITRLFASVLQGHWSELESVFKVSKDAPAGTNWIVSLEPIDAQMQKVVGKIEVAGCKDISAITVTRPNGDRDVIDFAPGSATTP